MTLKEGEAAKATLASACFPTLFSPVFWRTSIGGKGEDVVAKKSIKGKVNSILKGLGSVVASANYEKSVYEAEVENDVGDLLELERNSVAEKFHWFIDGGVTDTTGSLGLAEVSKRFTKSEAKRRLFALRAR